MVRRPAPGRPESETTQQLADRCAREARQRPQQRAVTTAQRSLSPAPTQTQTLQLEKLAMEGDGPRPTGASERRRQPRTVGLLQPCSDGSAAPQTRAPGPQNCSSCPPRLASRQASSRAPSRRSSRAPCRTHSRSAGGGSALAGALLGGQTAAVLRVWALSDRPEPGAACVRDGNVELQEALFASRKGAKRSLGRPCPGATKLGGLGGGAGLTLDQRKLGILRVPTGTRASC